MHFLQRVKIVEFFFLLSTLALEESWATSRLLLPAAITYIGGDDVTFNASASNVSSNATFSWHVNGTERATVTVINDTTTTHVVNSSAEEMSATARAGSVEMSFVMKSVAASLNGSKVTVAGEGLSATSTLLAQEIDTIGTTTRESASEAAATTQAATRAETARMTTPPPATSNRSETTMLSTTSSSTESPPITATPPPNFPSAVATIVGLNATFSYTANLTSEGYNYSWNVSGRQQASVQVNPQTLEPSVNIADKYKYGLTATSETANTMRMVFTVIDASWSQRDAVVSVGDGLMTFRTAILSVTDRCGTPPAEFAVVKCPDNGNSGQGEYNCQAVKLYKVEGPFLNCIDTAVCGGNAQWKVLAENVCNAAVACVDRTKWGVNCTSGCGPGCPNQGRCDFLTGTCMYPHNCLPGFQNADQKCTTCKDGYELTDGICHPLCEYDCNGGTCLGPNFCGNCPLHYAAGPTCRNIRLDGFAKGSLPTFAVLAVIILLLTFGSKWHIRQKMKES